MIQLEVEHKNSAAGSRNEGGGTFAESRRNCNILMSLTVLKLTCPQLGKRHFIIFDLVHYNPVVICTQQGKKAADRKSHH